MTPLLYFTPLRRSLKVARGVVAIFATAFLVTAIALYGLAVIDPEPMTKVPFIGIGAPGLATGLLVASAAMWVVFWLINHSVGWVKQESELQMQAFLKSRGRHHS